MTDPLDLIRHAANRAAELLTILDREHTDASLHSRARAVRHEVRTIQDELSRVFSDVLAPNPGLARSDGPETSKAAARAIATSSGSQRHRLLAELGREDLADWQLQDRTRIGASSERPRRVELMRAGYVEAARTESGALLTRNHPQSDLPCQVWHITTKGAMALRQLASGQIAMSFPDPPA